MNRFAFIIHPISVADIARRYPIAAKLPDWLVELATARVVKPKPVSEITGIRSAHDGSEVSGCFIACPLTTRQLVDWPTAKTLPVIVESARVAQREGASVVGLGAMTSVVGDAGITVNDQVDIAVTTGNSYTVATAVEGAKKAAAMMGIDLAAARVAILGATGSIGRVCGGIMARDCAEVALIVRDRARGEQVAEEVCACGRAAVCVSTDLDTALPTADIVICVSAAQETLVKPHHLKSGAVVCDVARPRDVSREVAAQRDDVLVIEGGVVRPPGEPAFNFNFGFPPGLAYACMAETSLLAMTGRFESYSLGRELDPRKVDEIAALAELHGYRLAGFRSFERQLTDEQIACCRDRAEARREAQAA